jgi:hypothetical protein
MSSQQSSPESQACQTPSPANALGSANVTTVGGATISMPNLHAAAGKMDIANMVPMPW